ncbi:MAG: GxxExxY protein [Thermodesulfovibrionales bacterium]
MRDKRGAGKGAERRAFSEEDLDGMVVAAASEVHALLGPGLLESAYEECFCRELELRGIPFRRQVPLPVEYKGAALDCGYRMDVVVADREVVEIVCSGGVTALDESRLLTYLRLSGLRAGLIINFHVADLKDGLKRLAL